MGRARMRDNSSSPRSDEDSAAPFIPADPSLSPSGLPQSKPLSRRFERPSFFHIAILTVLCLITYPAFYALTFVAKDKSLFVVRLIVSAWCSGIGFALGYMLLAIGAQHLEAASEFVVVEGVGGSLILHSKQPGLP